jgi:hypothetical protein
MNVNISIDRKTLDAKVEFKFDKINGLEDLMDSVAIISMIAGDFSLDPELDLEDLQELVNNGKEQGSKSIIFEIGEDGIEAEYSK